jgi:hypothetical protein
MCEHTLLCAFIIISLGSHECGVLRLEETMLNSSSPSFPTLDPGLSEGPLSELLV